MPDAAPASAGYAWSQCATPKAARVPIRHLDCLAARPQVPPPWTSPALRRSAGSGIGTRTSEPRDRAAWTVAESVREADIDHGAWSSRRGNYVSTDGRRPLNL